MDITVSVTYGAPPDAPTLAECLARLLDSAAPPEEG